MRGATETQLVTLYSNLYRLNLYPNSQSENTGTAAAPRWQYASPVSAPTGASTPTQTGAKIVDGQIYVNNGFWDTYRTVWPAYALLYPDVAGRDRPTGSSSSTATAAGSPAGRRPATPT